MWKSQELTTLDTFPSMESAWSSSRPRSLTVSENVDFKGSEDTEEVVLTIITSGSELVGYQNFQNRLFMSKL